MARIEGHNGTRRLGRTIDDSPEARRALRARDARATGAPARPSPATGSRPTGATGSSGPIEPARARPTSGSRATALASTRFAAGYQAFRLQERFDAERRRQTEVQATERQDRAYADYARLHQRAEAALAGVPSDIATLSFEPERANRGAEELQSSWRQALAGAIGPGDRSAVGRTLADNAEQLDVLAAATLGTTRPEDPDRLAERPGAEHLYEPLIAALAAEHPDARFELVAADPSVRTGAAGPGAGDVPLIAMTETGEDGAPRTTFFEVRPDAVTLPPGATQLEEAVHASGHAEAWQGAFQARPEYAAFDAGEDTLFHLQREAPTAAFDVLGDLPPGAQADVMRAYAGLAGDRTFGGLLAEVDPPGSVLVAVGADHLARGGQVPDVVRSTVDVGGVPDNGKEAAVLEAHRDDLYAPVFSQYLLRGERPPLAGAALVNEIGAAFGLPPNNPPDTPEALAAFERGALPLYEGEALAALQPVIDQIEATAGSPARVEVIPLMVESDLTGRPPRAPIPLFRVEGRDGQTWFVDGEARRYRDLEDWRQNNRLPPGTVSYPAGLALESANADRPGEVRFVTEATHAVVDTPGEYVLSALDTAAVAGGIVLGGAAIVATGGTASPAVVAALAWGGGALAGYGAARAGIGLYDLATHGVSLNPLESGEARSLWLEGAASAFAFGALGSAGAARSLLRAGGAPLAQGFARSAVGLGVASGVADAGTIANLAHGLARDWDDLSGQQRAEIALQIGFWGGLGATTAGGLYSGRSVRRGLEDAALAGAVDARLTAPAETLGARAIEDPLGDLSSHRTEHAHGGLVGVPGSHFVEEAAENLQRLPQFAHIPQSDLEALLLYTGSPGVVGGHWRIVNQALRGGDPARLAEAAPLIRSVASGLNHLPSHRGTVYRRTELPPEVAAGLVPGASYSDPAFLSTTTVSPAGNVAGGEFLFVIDAHRNGRDISGLSGFRGEAEVLFLPGTDFRVERRHVDPATGLTVVHLTEL